MGGRKKRSAIDAVITLIHNIELTKNQGNTLSCLMLDVKGAFNYISIYQLLAIMEKLQLSQEIQKWIKSFLQKRKTELAFNEERQQVQDIEIEIPQESPISPILFLIYIRFLFSKIKAKFSQVQKPSYIDDVALYVTGKSAKENSEMEDNELTPSCSVSC